jgi:hypothetical protein
MPKHRTGEAEARTQKGREAIEEAARLLRQMQFSQDYGAYAEGYHVAVSVDPRWNADHETVSVLITCYPFGHRRTDWALLPIHVLPKGGGSGVHAIARLDARGQALIPTLPPGDYRLSLRIKPIQVELVLFRQHERLAAQGEDEQYERRLWRGEGEDGAIVWTIEETEEGDIQIAFETNEERLSGHGVVFSLVDPDSKRVQYSHRLTLEPARTLGKWEGWCSVGSQTDLQGPYELVFEVVPPDETE